jgi:16S rRNA (guanine966-N2)-methyltransferase
MKVIAGKVKGYPLKSPKNLNFHPTSQLVRGAIFSSLESIATDWSRVLDLYAGTGALGIEALSRGAEWVDFVEQDRRCCAIIKENLRFTGFAEQAKVYQLNARKALTRLPEKYDLIFLDPPYSDHFALSILEELFSSPLVKIQSTIVMEHLSYVSLAESYGNFSLVKKLRHGDTCVSIYQSIGGEF